MLDMHAGIHTPRIPTCAMTCTATSLAHWMMTFDANMHIDVSLVWDRQDYILRSTSHTQSMMWVIHVSVPVIRHVAGHVVMHV